MNQNTLLKGYGDLVFHNVAKKLFIIFVSNLYILDSCKEDQILNGEIILIFVREYIHHGEYSINLLSLNDVEIFSGEYSIVL